MLNKVLLIGNLGRDPEVRSTPSGQPVASFTLATNRRWRDKSGAKQEQTEWHNIVVWGRQAEIAGQYLTKGSRSTSRAAQTVGGRQRRGEEVRRVRLATSERGEPGRRLRRSRSGHPAEGDYDEAPLRRRRRGGGGGRLPV